MNDPRPTGKTKWEIYTSKIAFVVPMPKWLKDEGVPVSLFVVHFVIAVAAVVAVERLFAYGVFS